MNVQFAVQLRPTERASPWTVFVLEVNPRASRTVPFVSKATGVPLARFATLIMIGKTLDELGIHDEVVPQHFSVKESVFPFSKLPGVDIILGPEMRSTGEVMGLDDDMPMAFAKSQMAASAPLPKKGTVFITVADRDKPEAVPLAREFAAMGYRLFATRGTAATLRKAGITVTEIPKLLEGRPNLVDRIKSGEISLVINTASGRGARADEAKIRASSVAHGVTCITTLSAGQAAAAACRAIRERDMTVTPLQERYRN
jgi:carbamoyl-phosphate synthase large subunit